MTPGAGGRFLLAAGGLLVILGSFFPEVRVAVANRVRPDSLMASPDRSHWVVFREDIDILTDPDPALGFRFYAFYVGEAVGLAYLAAVGLSLSASAAAERSRAAAIALCVAHAACLSILVAASLASSLRPSVGESDSLSRLLLGGAILLAGVLVAEVALGWRTLRARGVLGLAPVDAVGILPATLLAFVNAGLFVALRGHPNWPAGGYLVGSAGFFLAVGGMLLRRESRRRAAASGS